MNEPVPYYIEAAKRVLANGMYEKVDGMILDGYTASAMIQVWDALGKDRQAVITTKGATFTRYVEFAWKCVR